MLLLPVVLYVAGGTLGGWIKAGDVAGVNATVRIGLLPGPIHTDLVLPATPALRERFEFLQDAGLPINAPETAWVVVGWGARDFYTTTGTYADLRFGPVLRAITGDRAVMRVLLVSQIRDARGLRWIDLTEEQYGALITLVRADFAGDVPLPLDHPGLNGNDVFYPATGRFHLLRTCNVWVGDVLREVGIRVGVWTPFTWSLR
ncbi:MAG: TIGR02117 family protein [Pseudomonadota bacterium]